MEGERDEEKKSLCTGTRFCKFYKICMKWKTTIVRALNSRRFQRFRRERSENCSFDYVVTFKSIEFEILFGFVCAVFGSEREVNRCKSEENVFLCLLFVREKAFAKIEDLRRDWWAGLDFLMTSFPSHESWWFDFEMDSVGVLSECILSELCTQNETFQEEVIFWV